MKVLWTNEIVFSKNSMEKFWAKCYAKSKLKIQYLFKYCVLVFLINKRNTHTHVQPWKFKVYVGCGHTQDIYQISRHQVMTFVSILPDLHNGKGNQNEREKEKENEKVEHLDICWNKYKLKHMTFKCSNESWMFLSLSF